MPLSVRNRYFLLSDLPFLAVLPFIAAALRFEGWEWSAAYAETIAMYALLVLPVKLAVCLTFGLYRRLWRHASLPDMVTVLKAGAVSAAACTVLGVVILPLSGLTSVRVPLSILTTDAFFTLSVIAAPRMLIRTFETWRQRRLTDGGRRVLIAGAGAAGQMILREMLQNPQLGLAPVGFVDDDPAKRGHHLEDLPIFGTLAELPEVIKRRRIGEIVIAMPTAPGPAIRTIVRTATEAQIPTRTVPALYDIIAGRVRLSHLRRVEIQDLLRREPVQTDLEPVRQLVQGRVVLVTGAGGSIGSELSRQTARLKPARLILLGNSENEIFDIQNELRDAHPRLTMTAVIADVRDHNRLSGVFRQYRPDVVFHAAAHKHVPLMEENVADAVTNNAEGTATLLECAIAANTERFVQISTDKAVRPTSVMGATKRVAEMIVQRAAMRYRRNFVSVRFGNVLGSRGSVVPTFLQQIRAGGPVTITHPAMQRYFMTVPEAVQLVLQAAVLGRGAEVFVLDMGDPVRIVDLATDMIRLSGLEVGKDVEIRYTGVRPGERLFEERFWGGEDVAPTAHPKVVYARNALLPPGFGEMLDELLEAARECRPAEELRRLLKALVPDFTGQKLDAPPILARPAAALHSRPHPLVVDRRNDPDRRISQRRAGFGTAPASERRAEGDRRSGLERRGTVREAEVPAEALPHTRSSPGVA
jgi:FlaA1/EpsC-like NDP-sugar epimerase